MTELDRLIEAAQQGDLETVTSIARMHPELVNQRDHFGATPLHHAAFAGHSAVVRELAKQGSEINARDGKFGATPTGWAIEYLRELGGFLGIELDDFAFAIRQGDVRWTKRFLNRFPGLRDASDTQGQPFKTLAQQSGNQEIAKLFDSNAA